MAAGNWFGNLADAKLPGAYERGLRSLGAVPLDHMTAGLFSAAADTDVQRDKQLLKDRPWFDIGIIYTSGRRPSWGLKRVSQATARPPKYSLPGTRNRDLAYLVGLAGDLVGRAAEFRLKRLFA